MAHFSNGQILKTNYNNLYKKTMRSIPPTNQKFKLIKTTNTFFRREKHIMIKKNYLHENF